jgi:hypothetical protein
MFDGVDLQRNNPRVIDNQYLATILCKKEHKFQINVFREFAVVFDGEYCAFLRTHN